MKFLAVIACLGLLCGTVFAVEDNNKIGNAENTNSPVASPVTDTSRKNSADLSAGNIPVPVNTALNQAIVPAVATESNATRLDLTASSANSTNATNESTLEAISTPEASPTPASPTPASPTPTSPTPTSPTPASPTPASSTSTSSTAQPVPSTKPTTKPDTPSTASPIPTTVSPKPEPSPTPNTPSTQTPVTVPTKPTDSSTKPPLTTEVTPSAKPATDRQFDGPSFIGGIVFALGVTAIAFVAWKFYKARTERNYHTL